MDKRERDPLPPPEEALRGRKPSAGGSPPQEEEENGNPEEIVIFATETATVTRLSLTLTDEVRLTLVEFNSTMYSG